MDRHRIALAILVAAFVTTLNARPIVQNGPPPEIRALIDGVIQACNGDAAAWEAFAQKYFAPAYLKQQTPDQRAAMHQQIVDRFGTVHAGAA